MRSRIMLMCFFSARLFGQYSISANDPTTLAVERTNGGYDYVAAVMLDGVNRMWWCGSRPNLPADHILYAEATTLRGPWHAPGSTAGNSFVSLFGPTGNVKDFDGGQTCDPSVVRANGVYYLYYGGNSGDPDPAKAITAIGVMTSADGKSWQPVPSIGRTAILETHRDRRGTTPTYGTGQPSVIFLNGLFYLTYSDTRGLAADGNGGGQYILRSPDPTFYRRVETLTATGWTRIGDRAVGQLEDITRYKERTGYSLVDALSVDWAYSDMLNAFVFAINGSGPKRTDFFIFDLLNGAPKLLSGGAPGASSTLAVAVTGTSWTDGPALVRTPDGHFAPTLPNPECGAIPIQLVESVVPTGTQCPQGTDAYGKVVNQCIWVSKLHSLSATVRTQNSSCGSQTWSNVLDSWLMVSPGLPLAAVIDGKRVQFGLTATALQVSKNALQVDSVLYHQIPFGASLPERAIVDDADAGRAPAFLLNGNELWPSCAEMAAANQSSVVKLRVADYDKFARGSTFYCIK